MFRRRTKRGKRLGPPPQRLIETQADRIGRLARAEAARERFPVNLIELADPRQAETAQQGQRLRREAKGGHRQVRQPLGFPAGGQHGRLAQAGAPRQGMGGARCAGHRNPVAMASLHKAVGHPGHERRLAAKQVVAAGCLHHQPVFAVQGHERGETHHPGGKGRQGLQICRAVDFLGKEVRQGCFRIGETQARFDAHSPRRRIRGHDT